MKQEIQLFIGGQEVEFSKDPQILFNYKITDATNPTAIKNSYSKSISIEGTQKNNEIFGNIWNLERIQYYGYEGGPSFNPIQKTPFLLYVNGELYESGYVKLNDISKKNGNTTYSITLYGGLGSLFFSLSYNDEEGADKKTLADLRYGWSTTENDIYKELDLDFKINKETVFDAWYTLMGDPDAVYDEAETDRPNNYLYDRKWETLNFMTAYEGKPEDFAAEKVLINTNDNFFFTTSEDGYTTVNGFALGEMENEDLTQMETRDLRSYLQRPVIRMKSIIDACCDPANNGGWELKLDPRFFNWENPYYNDTWLTLGNIRDNLKGGEKETLTTATLAKEDNMHYRIYTSTQTLSEFTNIRLNFHLKFDNSAATTRNNLYMNYKYVGDTNYSVNDRVKYYHFESAFLVQLVAYDSIGNVVGQSDTQYLYGGTASGFGSIYNDFKSKWTADGVDAGKVKYRSGYFTKSGDSFVWTENGNGDPTALVFSLPSNIVFNYLKLKIWNPYKTHYKERFFGGNSETTTGPHTDQNKLWGTPYVEYDGNKTLSQAIAAGNPVNGTFSFGISDVNMISEDYETLFSNSTVPKEAILSTKYTPAEYLTGFAKMFGLYFWRDPSEESSDPALFPKGVIHLLERTTFYDEENIIDLSEYLDRGQEIKITPQIPTKKWIRFEVEQNDGEAANEYSKTYGEVYGSKRVDTNFNFNAETEDLIDKIPYRGAVDVLEVDKYFNRWIGDEVPTYVLNGFKYYLFKPSGDGYDTLEKPVDVERGSTISVNKNGWENTDSFAKVQMHSADNENVEGDNILVFYNGSSYYDELLTQKYWLTDDIQEMVTLNEGEPCFILTHTNETVSSYNLNGSIGPQTIAYGLNYIPKFQRTKIGYRGTITHSLDMGEPKETYVRDTFVNRDMSIYGKCWRPFMTDLYDTNNRRLTCYVRFPERPNAMMLRRFYWFDNALWRLNTITDWNVASYTPTKCEFVKVMDILNYRTERITSSASYVFELIGVEMDRMEEGQYGGVTRYYTIPAEGATFVGRMKTLDESWCLSEGEDGVYVSYSDGESEYMYFSDIMTPDNPCGSGDGERTFNIPANTRAYNREFNFFIIDNNDQYYRCLVTQLANDTEIDVTPISMTFNPTSIAATSLGGRYTVQISSSTADSYTIEGPDWISVLEQEETYFTLGVRANTSEFARIARILITASAAGKEDVEMYYMVSQAKTETITTTEE